MSNEQPPDLTPNSLKVYDYCVVYKKEGQWIVDQCDNYRNLPAHYSFKEEAEERLRFLRQRYIECRMAALLAEETRHRKSVCRESNPLQG